MDIITAKLGAKMAKKELAESGQIGYTENGWSKVFEASLSFEEVAPNTYMAQSEMATLKSEQDYRVTWGGDEYLCNSYTIGEDIVIGNMALSGEGEDTGEPFIILSAASMVMVVTNIGVGPISVTIAHSEETNYGINPKYLYSYFRFEDYGQTYPERNVAVSIDKETWQAMTDFLRVPGVIICQDISTTDANGLPLTLSERNIVVAVQDGSMTGVTYVRFRMASANNNYMLEFEYDGTTYSYTLSLVS